MTEQHMNSNSDIDSMVDELIIWAMAGMGAAGGIILSFMFVLASMSWSPLLYWAWVPPLVGLLVGSLVGLRLVTTAMNKEKGHE